LRDFDRKIMYDLIIIGGSAIGLFLAKEFAQKGNSVLLLEKKEKIGGKVCSGLVSQNIFKYIPEKDVDFFLEKEIKGARLWIEESPFFFKGKALLFHRDKFDEYLYKEALKSGANIILGQRIINVLEHSEFIEIFSEEGKTFKGKILAGCDGAVSLVAKRVGLPPPKNLLLGVVAYSDKKRKKDEDFVELFFSKKFSEFFAWKIPRDDRTEWGIALRVEKKPREKLEKLLTKNNLRIKKTIAALIPCFPLKKTTTKRVFLCGDSAGQIKPYTGGGIVYGFECARVAVGTIKDFDSPCLEKYEKQWRKSLMKKIYFGNFIKKCYSLPNFIKKSALSVLDKRKNLDQDDPSSLFRF